MGFALGLALLFLLLGFTDAKFSTEMVRAPVLTSELRNTNRGWQGLRLGGALVGGAALTTLIAGTAVAPFAIYHFHHMAHFGVVANMIVAPLVTLLRAGPGNLHRTISGVSA